MMFTTRNSHLITRSRRCSQLSSAWPTTSELQSKSWLVLPLHQALQKFWDETVHTQIWCLMLQVRNKMWNIKKKKEEKIKITKTKPFCVRIKLISCNFICSRWKQCVPVQQGSCGDFRYKTSYLFHSFFTPNL